MSLRVCTQGVGGGGGGNHGLFIFFMWLSLFLRSYRAHTLVAVCLLFSSGGSFVHQGEEFNTKTPGVNNSFDLTDKLVCLFASLRIKVFVPVCVCSVDSVSKNR